MNASTVCLAASNPVGHVTDKQIFGWYISNVTVMLLLSGIVTLLLLIPAARRIATCSKDRSRPLRWRPPLRLCGPHR